MNWQNFGFNLSDAAFSAKQDYVNAKYDYLINVLHLKASVGKLTEQDIQEMNAWLVDKARL